MFAPADATTAQPQPQPQPQGAAFQVGTGFDATVAMAPPTVAPPTVAPSTAMYATAVPPAALPRRRGRKALAGLLIVGVLAGGGVTANAVLRSGDAAVASGVRPIGSDLAGALPEQPAQPAVAVTQAPTTTGAPTTTAAPAPTTPPAPPAPPTTQPPAQPPAPTVVSVDAPTTVLCAPGDTPSIVISWSVAHADEVVLSIDGPGAYRTYPGANGSDAVPFACGEAQHAYTVTASADGHQSSRTVVVTRTEVGGGSQTLVSP